MPLYPRRTLYIPLVSALLLGAAACSPALADPAPVSALPVQSAAAVKTITSAAGVKTILPAPVAVAPVKVLLTTGVVPPVTAVKTVAPVSALSRPTRRGWPTTDSSLRYRSHAQWSTQQTSDAIKGR